VDDTVAELKRRDVTIVAGPMDFAEVRCRGVLFTNAWSNLFELTQPITA
jgi:hypothetical protein